MSLPLWVGALQQSRHIARQKEMCTAAGITIDGRKERELSRSAYAKPPTGVD